MADAVGGGGVGSPIGELDTIDGVATPAKPVRTIVGDDYPELANVERHHYVNPQEIARGGMGRVYEARDRRLGRQVAIKELLPRNRDHARRFEREARITARLQHPSIIHIYEAGVWPGGEPFFAMTRVAGRSLDTVVAERGTFDKRIALLPNVIAVVDALAYAHSQHVIHRDLKPSNVLIGEFGETVVIDWGLAKDLGALSDPKESLAMPALSRPEETASGSVVGTPAYMPPEQARGETVDQRSDVYSLGALLYHVLVGRPPYSGAASDDVLEQVKSTLPVAIRAREPAVPADLVAIAVKAMARDPGERYPSAAELAVDLKRFQTGQLVAAHHYTRRQLVRRWLRRYGVVAGIVVAALAALAVVGWFSLQQVISERNLAESARAKGETRRIALLFERGRTELVAGRAGPALAYLAGTQRGEAPTGAWAFLVAEAMRPFDAEVARLQAGTGSVVVAVAPDGKLVAGATGGPVELWRVDGTKVGTLARTETGRIRALAFDPAGTRVAAAGLDGVAWIWSVRAPGKPLELRGHRGVIADLSWSPDGTKLATAGADGTARVWDTTSGDEVHRSTWHHGALTSVRFSPDGDRIASASIDGTACVWSTESGETLAPLRAHTAAVNMVRWSADGTRVVTASDDGTARIWDPSLGKPVLGAAESKHAIAAALFSPDGRRIATVGADDIGVVWALPDNIPEDRALSIKPRVVAELVGHVDDIASVVFSRDGRRIATAGVDRVARVWDATNGRPIAAFEHADAVAGVAFAGDDRLLVTGSRDGTARIWDLSRGLERETRELDSPVLALAVSDAGLVAAGADDSRVTLWRTGGPAAVLAGHMGRVLAVAFSPDGTRLVTGGEDPQAFVWDPATKARVATLDGHGGPIHAIAFARGEVLTAAEDGVRAFDAATGHLARTLDTDGAPVRALAASGDLIAGATGDRDVLVWRGGTRTPSRLAIGARVIAVAFAPDGASFVAAGDGFARVYRVDGGGIAAQASLALEGPTGHVIEVAVSHDGSRIYTVSDDGAAKIWDADTGKLLGTRVVQGAATAAALGANDATLWVARKEGDVTAWDVHAASISRGDLDRFVARLVPWRLGDDDIVRRDEPGT